MERCIILLTMKEMNKKKKKLKKYLYKTIDKMNLTVYNIFDNREPGKGKKEGLTWITWYGATRKKIYFSNPNRTA